MSRSSRNECKIRSSEILSPQFQCKPLRLSKSTVVVGLDLAASLHISSVNAQRLEQTHGKRPRDASPSIQEIPSEAITENSVIYIPSS